MKLLAAALLLLAAPALAQNPSAAPDPFKAIAFLEGDWQAVAQDGKGTHVVGSYSFKPELGGHVLARHTTSLASCTGPATLDCEHRDLLYIFEEGPGQPLKAIYFDNEGHVIHYVVSTPDATSAVFQSEAALPGPRFRLTYELKGSVMTGRFQMQMPGQVEWKSYLEWSGRRQ